MKIIEGGVTAAKGFEAASTAAKIKYQDRTDMAMIYSQVPCECAGTFTTNVVKAACVKWDQQVVKSGAKAQAVIVNSGIANACTGAEGFGYCKDTADAAAEALGINADGVLIGSTGVIGKQLPIDRIVAGVKVLAEKKIPRPSVYRYENDGVIIQKTDITDRYSWATKTIVGMLENEVYLGHTVNCKTTTLSYKDRKKKVVPIENQFRFENTHEAIIDKETWDIVQKVREGRKRITKSGNINKYSGLLYCADCGARLTYNSGNKPKPKSYYFMCSSYRRHKDGDCILPHRIREIVLDEIVREEINQAIYYAVNEKNKFVECISKRSLSESRKKLSQKITELDKLNNRQNELNVIFRKLYEDNALGKIPDDQYRLLSDSYTAELHELKAKIPELQNQINEIKTEESNVDRFIALANKYIYIEELTPEILRTFVSKITIHENDKENPGAKYEIDIFLTHIGKFW